MNDNRAPKPVWFRGPSRLEHTPDMVLKMALAAELTSVIIIGTKPGGNLFLDMSGDVTNADGNWMIDKVKHDLLV